MPAIVLLLLRLVRGIWAGLKDPEFRSLFLLVLVVIGSGAWFYHGYEGWSWLDSFYFTIITLTTVGYGDFSPQTAAGKIFTIIYILVGLGIISSFVVLLAERQLGQQPRRQPRIMGRLTGRQQQDREADKDSGS